MKTLKAILALAMPLLMLAPSSLLASSHREAPVTATDRSADVTDWYAFVSYDNPNNVTMILNVDPLLEPSNGPNYFPFDDVWLSDGRRQQSKRRSGNRIPIPFHHDYPQSRPARRVCRQHRRFSADHHVDRPRFRRVESEPDLHRDHDQERRTDRSEQRRPNALRGSIERGSTDHAELPGAVSAGTYTLDDGIKVWAGTADDPFFIDLGATFDSINYRSGVGPVLSPAIDADSSHNYAPDAVGGFNVNSIVLEVPISMLTVDGQTHPASDKRAVIGTYGSTARLN